MATFCFKRVLGGFHHRVENWITGEKTRQLDDRIWAYPRLEEAMWEAVLEYMETYISRRHNTAAKNIATKPIIDLCLEAERRLVLRVPNRWW